MSASTSPRGLSMCASCPKPPEASPSCSPTTKRALRSSSLVSREVGSEVGRLGGHRSLRASAPPPPSPPPASPWPSSTPARPATSPRPWEGSPRPTRSTPSSSLASPRAVEPTPSALPDAEAQALQAILARRRQLLEMLTAENNRLQMAPEEALAKRIRAHIEVAREGDRAHRLRPRGGHRGERRFQGERGAPQERPRGRPVLARTLLAELPELGRAHPQAPVRLWWGSPPSTGIPARGVVSGRCGEAELR